MMMFFFLVLGEEILSLVDFMKFYFSLKSFFFDKLDLKIGKKKKAITTYHVLKILNYLTLNPTLSSINKNIFYNFL